MHIPLAFIKHFNGTIPKDIHKDQKGKSWHVRLQQSDGHLCFENGWHHFARRTMLQAVAIVKTIPFMNLEEDYEAEQTF
uniref:TF-B3 domain-containing protein n=1 Tax=Quercus lobata TaxID=97700 RepID=A0A7N2M1B8_QUELO